MKIETTKIFREELTLAIKNQIVTNHSDARVFTYTFNQMMICLDNKQYRDFHDASNMMSIIYDLLDIICREYNLQ